MLTRYIYDYFSTKLQTTQGNHLEIGCFDGDGIKELAILFPNKMFSMNMKNMANTPFNVWPIDYKDAPAFIAHYVYQSEESYVNRKLKLPTDSENSFRGIDQHMHRLYNDVDNFLVRNKYAGRVRHYLNIANNVTISNDVKEQIEEQLESLDESDVTLQESLDNELPKNETIL